MKGIELRAAKGTAMVGLDPVEGAWLGGGMKAAAVTSGSIRRQRLRRASGER
jgi:hypothetical protein